MGLSSKHVLLALVSVAGLMILAGSVVYSLYPATWIPVEATVRGVHIESTRPGTLQWSLIANSTYEISGQSYEAATDVFQDRDRAVTEAEQSNWPVGRTFRLYVDANNPQSASLSSDGGREAATVVAVLLTPALLIMLGLALLLVRRVRATRA